MFRFTIRDVLWLTVVVAISAAWWLEHRQNLLLAELTNRHSYNPEGGYVTDAKTAISIAIAVWEPIYGVKEIANEKPYRASLDRQHGIWTVEGSLPKGYHGGVAIAE